MRNSISAFRGKAGVALDHAVLHLDGAAHSVNYATELNERSITGAFDHTPVMHSDSWVDEIATQCTETGQRAILVGASEPAVPDQIRR